MKIETGLASESLATVPAAARRAEKLGFDGLLASENKHDPFLPLALAAEHSERLSLGTAVTIAFPRSPMVVASAAWDFQVLSKGRFVLGLGTQVKGHIERRFSVPWTAPGPRLREYILALRAIWHSWQTDGKLDYRGEHYSFTLMTPHFNPGPIEHPRIPVYIAGVNQYNCRLAGELCDGIRLHSFNTPKYLREVIMPAIAEGARRAGRPVGDVDVCGLIFVITGANETEIAKAKEEVRRRVSFYAATRTYRAVMEIHGWGEIADKLYRMSAEGRWDDMPREISDEMLDAFAVTGSYDAIAGRIKAVYGGLVNSIGLSLPAGSTIDDERLREIIKELKG